MLTPACQHERGKLRQFAAGQYPFTRHKLQLPQRIRLAWMAFSQSN